MSKIDKANKSLTISTIFAVIVNGFYYIKNTLIITLLPFQEFEFWSIKKVYSHTNLVKENLKYPLTYILIYW